MKRQKGFSTLYGILAILVVLIIGVIAWRVVALKKPVASINDTCQGTVGKSDPPICIPKAENKPAISSFEECAKAGNPIQESFPEKCSANGQTFTNTNAKAQTPTVSDDDAILTVLVANCAKNDATAADGAKKILTTTMKDPALYLKEGNFARVAVSCVEGEGGYRSFLQKKETAWSILGSGQMNTIGCDKLDGTGISAKLATTCFDASGEERPIK